MTRLAGRATAAAIAILCLAITAHGDAQTRNYAEDSCSNWSYASGGTLSADCHVDPSDSDSATNSTSIDLNFWVTIDIDAWLFWPGSDFLDYCEDVSFDTSTLELSATCDNRYGEPGFYYYGHDCDDIESTLDVSEMLLNKNGSLKAIRGPRDTTQRPRTPPCGVTGGN